MYGASMDFGGVLYMGFFGNFGSGSESPAIFSRIEREHNDTECHNGNIIYLHIYKTKTGVELIASSCENISKPGSVEQTWDFETKREARKAATRLKNIGPSLGLTVVKYNF